MKSEITIKSRAEVLQSDKWDLSGLFITEEDWEKALVKLEKSIPDIQKYKGTLHKSANQLKSCLDLVTKMEIQDERLGNYAFLKNTEDVGDSKGQDRLSRYMRVTSIFGTELSFLNPEIQSIDEDITNSYLKDDSLADYKLMLTKLLRFKPHVLSGKEEKLLAMQMESRQTPGKVFTALTDVDMEFGTVKTKDGDIPLSQSTFGMLLINNDRSVRETAYKQFYSKFSEHKNTLASLYAGSVQQDIYQAKVRDYPSTRAQKLFPDNVPESVYENLVTVIHEHLPLLHKYYAFRRKKLGLEKLKHWDVYVPLLSSISTKYSYEEAVELINKALSPLGEQYRTILKKGLLEGWVDRYENKGKRSGAFSSGGFTGNPYIMMNYKETVLRDIFTLAHEGGHSMHSYYSVENNNFQNYNYTIFEAEVASTFNEQLVADYLYKNADSNEMKAYIIGKRIDDIIATIFRQTMFAEFEHEAHAMVENGVPITVDSIRAKYRELMELYFGPDMELEEESDLEGLRIPHFYRSYYVYKYATGLSAAIALSERVLKGGDSEQKDYLNFLKSGGSKYPIDSLKLAGVDMSNPEPVKAAMKVFEELLDEMTELMK
ncbi:MAG: oligoendopeptidase F [Spirochaetia bacterium]|jgi:oligoendopeptidase F|nr:oligoendopeptidase F [Spirochaetia bacterium]